MVKRLGHITVSHVSQMQRSIEKKRKMYDFREQCQKATDAAINQAEKQPTTT